MLRVLPAKVCPELSRYLIKEFLKAVTKLSIVLTRYPEQMREHVKKFEIKRSRDSWTKLRDIGHTLIKYLLQQNRVGTGEDMTMEKEEDVRRYAGGIPLRTNLSLAMRTDPLALVRGVGEFVTTIYGPAVMFAFLDKKVVA